MLDRQTATAKDMGFAEELWAQGDVVKRLSVAACGSLLKPRAGYREGRLQKWDEAWNDLRFWAKHLGSVLQFPPM